MTSQVKYLNEAMTSHNISVVVPVNFVTFTVSAILAGAFFYDEFHSQNATSIFFFIFGCIINVFGVIFITDEKQVADDVIADDVSIKHMTPDFLRCLSSVTVQPRATDVSIYYQKTEKCKLITSK